MFIIAPTVALLESNLPKAWGAEGSLTEWDARQRWSGPVSNIHAIGLNTWEGHWSNDHNEGRTLIITLDEGNKTIIILEKEPNQVWSGHYGISGSNYLVKGTERSGKYEFSAVLTLE